MKRSKVVCFSLNFPNITLKTGRVCQKLLNARHALMRCCHDSVTQPGVVTVLSAGDGDVKPPPTMKMEHWA